MAITRPVNINYDHTYASKSHQSEIQDLASSLQQTDNTEKRSRFDHLQTGINNYSALMNFYSDQYKNRNHQERVLDAKVEMQEFQRQLNILKDEDGVGNDQRMLMALKESGKAVKEFIKYLEDADNSLKPIKPETYARMHILAETTNLIIKNRGQLANLDLQNHNPQNIFDLNKQVFVDQDAQGVDRANYQDANGNVDIYDLMLMQEACHHDISANDNDLGAQSTFGKIMHGALLAAGIVVGLAALAVIGLSIAATCGATIPFISAGLAMGSGFIGMLFPALSVTAAQIATTAVVGAIGLGLVAPVIGFGAAGVNARDALGATGIASTSFGVFATTKDAVAHEPTVFERISAKFGN